MISLLRTFYTEPRAIGETTAPGAVPTAVRSLDALDKPSASLRVQGKGGNIIDRRSIITSTAEIN